jgi:acyl-CoA reductase-like NAD-dependent aldehyde dehydrogenase
MALPNFINGEFIESLSGETDDVINPATGEVITVRSELERCGC